MSIFFGCTVESINSSAGFNGQTSTLSLSLVEDPRLNQFFIPAPIGSPVYFIYGSFNFGGILDSWNVSLSTDGRLIDVNIVDPREILAGVYLILGDYNGATSYVPNIMNVYGYLNNTYEFGYAGLTTDGIKWGKVVQGINELINSNTQYGGMISYRGYTYSILLDNLPQIPEDYRISGDMSLLDFISDICETGNADFLVSLRPGNEIYIRVITRNEQSSLGYISQFVNTVPNASVRQSGLSRVNEITNKFLLGSRKRELKYTFGNANYSTVDRSVVKEGKIVDSSYKTLYFDKYDTVTEMKNMNILPYFGKDINRNAVIGVGTGDWMAVNIDTRLTVMDGLDESYTATVGELRAALAGYEVWTQYLWAYCFNEYIAKFGINGTGWTGVDFSDDVETTDDYLYEIGIKAIGASDGKSWIDPSFEKGETVGYKATEYKNPHFRKAFDLRLEYPPFLPNKTAWAELKGIPAGTDLRKFLSAPPVYKNYFDKEYYTASQLLWSQINRFAEEYYGRKFMVKIENLKGASQVDTSDAIFNMEPVDGAYIEESLFDDAVKDNLLPFSLQDFSEENGLVQCFVRFDNFSLLDTSEMNPSNTFLNVNYKKLNKSKKTVGPPYAFVKCQVEDIVFFDHANKEDPRVVISLPFIPYVKTDLNPQIENNTFLKVVNNFSSDIADQTDPNNNQVIKMGLQLSKKATDIFGLKEAYIFPDMAAIPMESNEERYGPWYIVGADGPTEYIIDDNLCPWYFNGYENMNAVGLAIVNEGPQSQVTESGSIEIPGTPVMNLGDSLIAGGPYVTDIQVNIGIGGVTSVYRLEIWTPRFGKINKVFTDKVTRIQQELTKQKIFRRGLIKTYLRNK